MKLKTMIRGLFIIAVLIGINSCKVKTISTQSVNEVKNIGVFNFEKEEELAEFNKLNLDETYPNLLNPQISKSDYNSVIESWGDLHQRIGQHLSKNKFNWEVEDSTIAIFQKIYFNRNGEIENYLFRILNNDVTEEKKEQFAKLISTFAKDNHSEFKKDEKFAQCGKTNYTNR